ncbi:hypothetical protein RFN29_23965 [Mesorhizobium sp. VK22B]|uniref:Uncharacterized protein n=1 Tax=Mesorhizobium captivum TaxID=3072319 RepID=A0ABU4Z9H1_9HYPH|nr:hypothetical protein [Mesorhizobium sp. VK22B]MDX8494632.1 hypothetical protein [Mesorhizobium sp. VK22B]
MMALVPLSEVINDGACGQKEAVILKHDPTVNAWEDRPMGNVSLFEDISDRLTDEAVNVMVARSKLASIRHLPDGQGARLPRLRSDIAALWQEFENATRAVEACNRRPIPTGRKKRPKAMIDRAIESSWLVERMRQSIAKLARAYPSRHPSRLVLEDALRQIT